MVSDEVLDTLKLLTTDWPAESNLEHARQHRPSTELVSKILTLVFGTSGAPPALDLRSRTLASLGAISALGESRSYHLRETVRIARSIGLTREEISEAVFQPALVGGFASAIQALKIAFEVFAGEDKERATRG